MSAAEDTTQRALTERQRRFVDYYADHGNGAKAARQAGYSEESAKQIATENLSKPYLVEAIKIRRKELVEEAGVRPDAVLRMIAAVATFDIGEVLDDNGRVREISEMSDVARLVLQNVETFTVTAKDGSSFTTTSKVKIPDRLKALELLARHLGLFDDKLQMSGDVQNPFKLIIEQSQGHALHPAIERDDNDATNDIDDGAPTIDGEVIALSTKSTSNASSSAAFSDLDHDEVEETIHDEH